MAGLSFVDSSFIDNTLRNLEDEAKFAADTMGVCSQSKNKVLEDICNKLRSLEYSLCCAKLENHLEKIFKQCIANFLEQYDDHNGHNGNITKETNTSTSFTRFPKHTIEMLRFIVSGDSSPDIQINTTTRFKDAITEKHINTLIQILVTNSELELIIDTEISIGYTQHLLSHNANNDRLTVFYSFRIDPSDINNERFEQEIEQDDVYNQYLEYRDGTLCKSNRKHIELCFLDIMKLLAIHRASPLLRSTDVLVDEDYFP